MSFQNPSDEVIREILGTPRTIAVVGASPDVTRPSYRVSYFLQGCGHRVIPVNPQATEVLGAPCVPTLRDVADPVYMVDVFRRPSFVPEIVDDAIAIGARVLWLQLGVIHEDAAAHAQSAGLTVVMDRCPAIEYPRLFR